MKANQILVDTDGVILDKTVGIFTTYEERKRRKQMYEHKQQSAQLMEEIEKILGEFFFLNYKRLLENIQNDKALAFRYLYICTYANDIGTLLYKGKPMKHKDIVHVLNMNNKIASEEIRRMIDYNLLIVNENCYTINLYYYIRNMEIPNEFKGRSARIFDNGIRALYDISTPRHHALLGEIVPLLEYINKYNNILCTKETVTQRDFKKIQPLNMKEICEICGRSTENRTAFKNGLGKFKINGLPLFRTVVEHDKTVGYIINPYILYMGSRNDDLKFAFSLFDLNRR